MTDTSKTEPSRQQLRERLDSNADTVLAAVGRYNKRATSSEPKNAAYVEFLGKNHEAVNDALSKHKAAGAAYNSGADLSVATVEAAEQATAKLLQIEAKEPPKHDNTRPQDPKSSSSTSSSPQQEQAKPTPPATRQAAPSEPTRTTTSSQASSSEGNRRPLLIQRLLDRRTAKRLDSSLSQAGLQIEHVQAALNEALNTVVHDGDERRRAQDAFWDSVSTDPDLNVAIDASLKSTARDEDTQRRGVETFKTVLARKSNAYAMGAQEALDFLLGKREPAETNA